MVSKFFSAFSSPLVVCDSPVGEYGQDEIRVLSEAEQIQKSADVILIVEEKECNKDLTDKIGDIVDMYDTELKNVRRRFKIVPGVDFTKS